MNYEKTWTTSYGNLAVEQQETQDEAERFLGYLVDEGLSDNWFYP